MEKETVVQVGGDMETALNGHYIINPKKVIEEAWQKTKTTRWPINVGLLFVLMLGMTVSLIASQYLGGIENVLNSPDASLILNLLVTIIIWPFLAGVEMMGVLHAVGLKTHPKLVFSFLRRGSWVALCAVMTSVFVSLGLQLLIVPGLFLAVVFSLTIPLVVEKQLSPAKAIVISVKALRFQFLNIFLIYLSLFGALFVAVIPFALLQTVPGGALIAGVIFMVLISYIAPLYYNVKGVLYREIFGMKLQAVSTDESAGNGTFIA